MNPQSQSVRPPALALWLVNLFVLPEAAETIHGDLLEEFLQLASTSGAPRARRWFWRQTVKSIAQLAGIGFRTAPWLTVSAVAGGFILRRLLARLVEPAIFAVIEEFKVYEHHFEAYRFFASTGIDIGHLLTFLLIGSVVAWAARGREMQATMALGLIFATMAIIGCAANLIRTGDAASLWRLTWYFADSFAVVFSAVIVRSHRLGRKPASPAVS